MASGTIIVLWLSVVFGSTVNATETAISRPPSAAGQEFGSTGGTWYPAGVLYVPAAADNPEFRAELSSLLDGQPVDYFDARAGTPELESLLHYAAVLTWVDGPYADNILMGNRLADCVDANRRVILGQWCFSYGQRYFLQGRIMTSAYCPVAEVNGTSYCWYWGDGYDCVHMGVESYTSSWADVITALQPGASYDGTIDGEHPAVAFRNDRSVYYSAGNMAGSHGSTGDWAPLVAYMVAFCDHPRGACCYPDVYADPSEPGAGGLCVDYAIMCACEGQFHYQTWCDSLQPPCGNPGACCDDDSGVCQEALQALCMRRFAPGVTCLELEPPCGEWHPARVLYAPAAADNPAFRSELSALLGGAVVDYLDVRVYTPQLYELTDYLAVLTWVDHAYANPRAMGNVLADYVDHGGHVVLGQGCVYTSGSSCLGGRIMTAGYCPVLAAALGLGAVYDGDGLDCVHQGLAVGAYGAEAVDAITQLAPHAGVDGSFTETGTAAVAWRADRAVYYSPGQTGGTYGSGAWAQLAASMMQCPQPTLRGACCDPEIGWCSDGMTFGECSSVATEFYRDQRCVDLTPACGNPGACCDDYLLRCTDWVLEADCYGRFAGGRDCASNPFYPPCSLYRDCYHDIELYDSGGDGWNGSTLDVYVDGQLEWNHIELHGGSGGMSFSSAVYHGALITTVFNATGERPDEAYYIIRSTAGEVVQDGDGFTRPTGVSVYGRCPLLPEVGDLNCDGAVNAFDIDPFVLALTDSSAYRAAYPGCYYMMADVNGDGAANVFDIDPFAALLIAK